jgi:tyrosine-protein kinase Etk/Wzc
LLGIFIPAGIIYLKDMFSNKVIDKNDIQKITDFSFIGHIIHDNHKSNTVVNEFPNSLVAESFRSLRTNFQFISNKEKKNIILITSIITGEGKSYTSLNLATVFAQNQKKVILVDFDLRKSKIKDYLNVRTDNGLSKYLSNNSSIEDVIQKSEIENVDIITAGIIPPNPTELISSTKTAELFAILRKKYDYILIDSPPVGIVSDALLLFKYSDINLFILRYNFTPKNLLASIMDDLDKRKVENISLLLNDIKVSKSGYGYGYGYGYAYGYGYGNTENNNSFHKRILNTLFKN